MAFTPLGGSFQRPMDHAMATDLIRMKGDARPMMSLVGDEGRLMLVGYADGAMGIVRNERLIGVWEAGERDECLASFWAAAPKTGEAVDIPTDSKDEALHRAADAQGRASKSDDCFR